MRHRKPMPTRAWTADEDAKLRDMMRIGLASEFWHLELPTRSHGDICARRLELRVKIAPLL